MPDNDEVARRALSIATAFAHVDPGECAAARRMGPEGAPVFWRFVAQHGIALQDEERWRRITKLLAMLTPASATESVHERGRHLGAVLADGGDAHARLDKPALSEQRLARLLAARGAARLDALERAVRGLARHRPKVDVPSLAWAVLNDNTRAIARTYYARLDRRANADTADSAKKGNDT